MFDQPGLGLAVGAVVVSVEVVRVGVGDREAVSSRVVLPIETLEDNLGLHLCP